MSLKYVSHKGGGDIQNLKKEDFYFVVLIIVVRTFITTCMTD